MKILAMGDERRVEELKLKFGSQVFSDPVPGDDPSVLKEYEVIFDLNADEGISVPSSVALLENK